MMTANYELSMEALNLVVGGAGEASTQEPNGWSPIFSEADDTFNPEYGIPRGGRVGIRV